MIEDLTTGITKIKSSYRSHNSFHGLLKQTAFEVCGDVDLDSVKLCLIKLWITAYMLLPSGREIISRCIQEFKLE